MERAATGVVFGVGQVLYRGVGRQVAREGGGVKCGTPFVILGLAEGVRRGVGVASVDAGVLSGAFVSVLVSVVSVLAGGFFPA